MRPCKVLIYSSKGRDAIGEWKPAIFHRFNYVSDVVNPSLMVGGHPGFDNQVRPIFPGGVVANTYAIVERTDGRLVRVGLGDIQFYDSKKYFEEFEDYFENDELIAKEDV